MKACHNLFLLKNFKNLINYEIDITEGQSGSGMWYKEDYKYYAIGIHTTGAGKSYTTNTPNFFNDDRVSQIKDWIREHNKEINRLDQIDISSTTWFSSNINTVTDVLIKKWSVSQKFEYIQKLLRWSSSHYSN